MGENQKTEAIKIKRHILLKIFLIFCILGLSCIAALIGYVFMLDEWKDFDPSIAGRMDQTLVIYDKDGQVMNNVPGSENRIKVSIHDVPEHVQSAFIAVEDARFYEHSGVDIRRIAGALIADIQSGSLNEGASTISQQLIKLKYLSTEKTWERKIQEALMSMELESYYEKDQILEMYLNCIYFGNGAYGIETAAQAYFGKSASELTIAQGALLAGVINAPSRYAPHIQPEASLERRNLVLNRMLDQGYITEQQAAQAKAEKLALVESAETYQYGYYTDMVITEAARSLDISVDELLSGGYQIHTNMDRELQSYLEQLCEEKALFPEDAADGVQAQTAITVLHPQTNDILAVIGGREYSVRRGLNRVTQLYRQPGSCIKPALVYAPALEKGYTSCTMILDEQKDFNGYAPRNYADIYYGWVSMRDSIAKSMNVSAVQIFEDIGIETGVEFAKSLGIPFEPSDSNLALSLGGMAKGVTPLQLAASYSPFANGGTFTEPGCVKEICDQNGKTLYSSDMPTRAVMSEENAYIMTDMMSSTVEYGSAKGLQSVGIPLSSKTGTTGIANSDSNKDAWVVAYNTEYNICVWMGFDDTDEAHCLPPGFTGGTLPTELAAKIFSHIYEDRSAPDFEIPANIVQAEINKDTLYDQKKIELANQGTASVTTEVFALASLPDGKDNAWLNPAPPSGLHVSPANRNALITFYAEDESATYRLYRQYMGETEAQLIYTHEGGGNAQAVDAFSRSKNCFYYVIAEYRRILLGGKPVQGSPSDPVYYNPALQDVYTPPPPSPTESGDHTQQPPSTPLPETPTPIVSPSASPHSPTPSITPAPEDTTPDTTPPDHSARPSRPPMPSPSLPAQVPSPTPSKPSTTYTW